MKDISIILPVFSAVIGATTAFLFNLLLTRSGGIKFKPKQAFLAKIEDSYDLIKTRNWKREYAIDYYHHSLENDVLNIEFLVLNTATTPKIIIDIEGEFNNCSGLQLYKIENCEEGIDREREKNNSIDVNIINYITLPPGGAKIIKAILFLNDEDLEGTKFDEHKFSLIYVNPRTNFWKLSKRKKVKFSMNGYERFEKNL